MISGGYCGNNRGETLASQPRARLQNGREIPPIEIIKFTRSRTGSRATERDRYRGIARPRFPSSLCTFHREKPFGFVFIRGNRSCFLATKYSP